jgi:hypothetical protein
MTSGHTQIFLALKASQTVGGELPNKLCSSDLSGYQYIDDEALQNTVYH